MQPDPEYIKEWQANLHARRLHDKGLSFNAIGVVIEDLYGISRSGAQWRHELVRRQGSSRRAPRGVPFGKAAA